MSVSSPPRDDTDYAFSDKKYGKECFPKKNQGLCPFDPAVCGNPSSYAEGA